MRETILTKIQDGVVCTLLGIPPLIGYFEKGGKFKIFSISFIVINCLKSFFNESE